MSSLVLRTRSRETGVGFCSVCGIVREDVDGVPVTDCVCSAKLKHAEDCLYVKAVSMWISVDVPLDQLREAVECADAMEAWRLEHRPLKKAPNDFELEVARDRVLEAARKWHQAQSVNENELDAAVDAYEKALQP